MDIIAAEGITVAFDRECGVIDDLAIDAPTDKLRPLHRAPWLDDGKELAAMIAPIERRLAGDFFCAPFGRSRPDLPIHGWAANGSWESVGQENATDGSMTNTYRLRQTVEGARLTKSIILRPGHPIVYQKHVLEGGAGYIPVAHHAMLHVPGGAQLSFSKKLVGRTPRAALEPDPARGRSILAYPQTFDDLSSVRRADGTSSDASFYPFEAGHEDLIVLSEMPSAKIGWSAALARADGFLFFAVKDAQRLPHTVLWMSNGGRTYAPWNGRHCAVIGIEEAAVGLHLEAGEEEGLATGIALGDGRVSAIRYAFGAIPVPENWSRVKDIEFAAGSITLVDASCDRRTLPFDSGHFNGLGLPAESTPK